MSDIWTKALRGGPTTARTKSYGNNRYGSKGPDDVEDSADSGQKRTPRQASMYDRPWKDLASLSSASRGGTPRSRTYARPPIPRTNSNIDDGDAASVAESDDISIATEDDFRVDCGQEGESVQVFVRVRPINSTEAAEGEHYNCTRIYGDRTVSVELKHRPEPYQFKFDCVLPENTTQLEIFERAGKPIVDNCMGGYNSTIFAYGQTGAGKTYTMQGPLAAEDTEERGLAPRVFEYLFAEIDKAQDESCHENLTFCCRCSMLEIYNEVITDLLNPSATNLQIREDIKRGCYVEDLSEQLIQNVSDAMRLMRTGAENRHVGETRLNRESSRSHSVFACTLERHSKSEETGVTNVLFSRLNLIDLAGSERIHGGEHGGSQATGKHFKEACHINKSLTTLGRVIMELVEAQRTGGRGSAGGSGVSKGMSSANKTRHVPYRDSRLTFLLQDSLGGNAKTLMIANISPSSVSAQETLSTLQFMSRAKCIRNRATINLDARGDVVLLQREIVRLNTELDNLRKGYTEPAVQENKELRIKLEEMCAAKGQMEALMLGLEKENQNLKAERRRLDHKMSQIQKGAGQLDQAIFSLTAKVMHHESLAAAATEKSLAAAKAEHELQLAELQLVVQQHATGADQLQQVVDELQEELQQERCVRKETELRLQAELRDSVAAAAEKVQLVQKELQNVHATVEDLKAENDQLREQLVEGRDHGDQQAQKLAAEASATKAAMQQQLDGAAESLAALQKQLEEANAHNTSLQQQLEATMAEGANARQELEAANADGAYLRQQLQQSNQEAAEARQQLDAATSVGADLRRQLQEAAASSASLQQQLAAACDARDEAREALEVSKTVNAGLDDQNKQLIEQTEQMGSKLMHKDELLSSISHELSETQHKLHAVQAELAAAHAQLAAQQQDAATQADSSKSERQELQEQLQQAQQQLAVAKEQNEEAAQQVMQLTDKAADLEQQVHDLAARNSGACSTNEELQQRLAELNQQLQDTVASSAAEKAAQEAQVQELQQQLEVEKGLVTERSNQAVALEEALSELNAALKDKSQDLETSQEQCKQLQQQLEASTVAAAAKADQLSHDLAAARESSKSRQEELMKQVTEVHLQLSTAQQEQERLQDELDAARSDIGLLKAQLADNEGQIDKLRGQASSKALDCDLLRKKLSAAETSISGLKIELSEREEELEDMKVTLQKTEAAAQVEQEKAAEQMNSLQRELMDSQELLESKNFEVTQMQRRLEELAHRLTDKNSSLDAHKQEVKSLKSTVAKMDALARERDALLAEKTELVDRLQAETEVLNSRLHKLQEDLASKETQLRCKLNANELQLKEQIVYNARNRQAMNEIRKVINWAQQAPAPSTLNSPVAAHHGRGRERQQQLPGSPTAALTAEEHFVDEGFGTAPGSSAFAGSNSSSHSSGGSSSRSRVGSGGGAGQLAPGLPGPVGDCLPLMLEEVELSMPLSSLLGAKRLSDGAGSCGGAAAAGPGDGDGLVAVTVGGGSGNRPSRSKGSNGSKGRLPDAEVSGVGSGLHEAQEGSYQEVQQLFSEESRGDVGSDCSRTLLVPEQTSSPVRLSTEDSLQHLGSPRQRSRSSTNRNSRRADRDTARRGLRLGSDHHNFSGSKKHNVLMSADGNVVLSVSAEWAAGGHEHQQPDMRLPAAIVGDCDCEQDT